MYDLQYNFIKNTLMLNCHLLTQTVLLMKKNQTLVTFQKIQFFDNGNKKFIGKMKYVSAAKIIDEFVGLK